MLCGLALGGHRARGMDGAGTWGDGRAHPPGTPALHSELPHGAAGRAARGTLLTRTSDLGGSRGFRGQRLPPVFCGFISSHRCSSQPATEQTGKWREDKTAPHPFSPTPPSHTDKDTCMHRHSPWSPRDCMAGTGARPLVPVPLPHYRHGRSVLSSRPAGRQLAWQPFLYPVPLLHHTCQQPQGHTEPRPLMQK